MIPDKYKLI